MSLFSVTSLMIFIASISFASFLYYGNKKSKINQAWLLTSAAISIWGLALFGVTTSSRYEVALLWQYALDVAASFIPVLYYIFISRFLGLNNRRSKVVALVFGFLFAVFSFTPYFKTGIQTLDNFGFFWINPGVLYFLFPLFFAVYFLLSLVELYKKYVVTVDRNRRAQILSMLLVGAIGLGAGGTNFFPQLFNIYPFGNYFLLLYIFFMSIGALRHQLFSVKVLSANLFSGGLLLVLFFNLLSADSLNDWLFALLVLLAVSFFSFFLVKSVGVEVRTREQVEKLAKDLSAANSKLQKINALKTEFVSVATHQLRGPLTAIKGYSSMLLDGTYGSVPEDIKLPIERIYTSTVSLAQVVQDFLDVSRIEQGSIKYEMSAFNFADLVAEVLNELRPNIEASKLEFGYEVEMEDGLEEDENVARYILRGDRLKLKQVVSNLVDNAIKYTKSGSVHISLSEREGKIRFEVKDSGVGIDAKTLKLLFQKFERADGADEINVSGTGLGLYIAREIVEAHKGKIWVESDGLGKGSTFIIELSR